MLDAFASLSTLIASDRSAVAAFTMTSSTLAANCTATHDLLVTVLYDVNKLQSSVANLKQQLSNISSVRSHINHYY